MTSRHYYPITEAVRKIKGTGINISINDVLHFGFLGKIRLFTHIPNGILITSLYKANNQNSSNNQNKKLLILSTIQCAEIECNKETNQSEFPSIYDSFLNLTETPSLEKSGPMADTPLWQTVDSENNVRKITITPQNLCISQIEFKNLLTAITQEKQLATYQIKHKEQAHKQILEERQNLINSICYSFDDALKIVQNKTPDFTENDLLRHGYFETISLICPGPIEHNTWLIDRKFDRYEPPSTHPIPNLIKIDPVDCYKIEILKKISISSFRIGFKILNETLIPCISPRKIIQTPENTGEAVTNPNTNISQKPIKKETQEQLQWCFFNPSAMTPIIYNQISKNDLYIMQSDIHRLIEQDPIKKLHHPQKTKHYPRFTIDITTKILLEPKKFPTLEEAADQLNYPIKSLITAASEYLIELFTPVPCEVSVNRSNKSTNNSGKIIDTPHPSDQFYLSEHPTPEFFKINRQDCEFLLKNSSHKTGMFDQGYLNSKRLSPPSPDDHPDANPFLTLSLDSATEGPWETRYLEKPVELDLTYNRIHLDLLKAKKTINRIPKFFEITKNDTESTLINDNLITSPKTPDKPVPLLNRLISLKDVEDFLGTSRSNVYKIINNKSTLQATPFPAKIKFENGRVFFEKIDFETWCQTNPHMIKTTNVSSAKSRRNKPKKQD